MMPEMQTGLTKKTDWKDGGVERKVEITARVSGRH